MLQIITCSYSFISDQANVPENLRGFAKCKGLGTGEACCQTLFSLQNSKQFKTKNMQRSLLVYFFMAGQTNL